MNKAIAIINDEAAEAMLYAEMEQTDSEVNALIATLSQSALSQHNSGANQQAKEALSAAYNMLTG
ncbi:MAG: hypothetical protein LBK00_06055 [Treponema sp.]|jgi:hypothetical protein|nr:hypothetical protein [Treponema sp.]